MRGSNILLKKELRTAEALEETVTTLTEQERMIKMSKILI